jgi:hypothetical protein
MSLVIVPHIDHPDFMEGAKKTSQKLQEAGFEVCELKDDQAFVVQNQLQKII